jgi:glutamine amidotransferase-like uncharacterized protein
MLEILDPTHPLVLGYRGSHNPAGVWTANHIPALYYSEPFAEIPGGPLFKPGRGVTVVARYADADADPDSSKLIHPEFFATQAGHAAILYRRVGRGHVCVYGIEPAFRGAWWSTARLLANALYLAVRSAG